MRKSQILNRILTAFYFITITLTVNAQKLPQIQEVSVRAPDKVKIDGRLDEWPNPLLNAQKTDGYLNAYNSTSRIYYTVANDDENLYIVVRGLGTRVTRKSLEGGIIFTISHSIEKKSRAKAADNVEVTFPLPVDDKTIAKVLSPIWAGVNFYNEEEIYPPGYPYIKQLDSIQTLSNAILTPFIQEIKVKGVKEIPDTLLSVYNETGIKAMMQFTWRQPSYELAIPLKYLKLDINNPVKFSYNIRFNLRGEKPDLKDYPSFDGGVDLSHVDPGTMFMLAPTDFWGIYTLAKK